MYYQITFTLDKRIRGRYEMPHTVKIKSKDFLDYMSEKNRNILMYFENEHDIYLNSATLGFKLIYKFLSNKKLPRILPCQIFHLS